MRMPRGSRPCSSARVFPPRRPRSGVEGDAAILRFLEEHDFPAERLAVDDAVSDFEGRSVLVTEFVSAEGVFRRNERTRAYLDFDECERPLGVHVVGDDYANPPPAAALGRLRARLAGKGQRPSMLKEDYRCWKPPPGGSASARMRT